jgi:hypothetical protein
MHIVHAVNPEQAARRFATQMKERPFAMDIDVSLRDDFSDAKTFRFPPQNAGEK